MSTKNANEPQARSDNRWVGLLPLLLVPFLFWGGDERTEAGEPAANAVGVEALGTELPLHVNARVQRWLDRFQTTQKDAFQLLLERRGVYGPLIREKLRKRGMPEELLYLAMMESGLSPWAVSKVSAVGLWQFMTPTAQQFGLRVDDFVDERRDPVAATDAALDYLEWLHDRFGSWYLAAAAYNAGPGRVQRVLGRHAEGRTGEENLYWEVLDHLPRETREYVPRLVAATILAGEADRAQRADALAFAASTVEPYRFDRVFVPGGTPLARVARALDVDVRVLRNLNPHLIRGITPPGETYGVRVPVGDSPRVVAALVRRAD
jgi:peptidoglycan lytic transglycosylase D